jgi:membrane protease YdiL (CAAX protease family)
MSYRPHNILVDRAAPRSEAWRLLLGMVLIAVLSLAFMGAWILVQGQFAASAATSGPLGSTPPRMALLLAAFLCPFLALTIVLRLLHKRGVLSLVGPVGQTLSDFIRVLGVMVVVVIVALLWPTPEGMEVQRNMSTARWLSWLPVAIVVLFIQIGTEELIFRGYLQSQLAARFRSPLVWIVLPSLMFALLHLDPVQGSNQWMVVGLTGLFAVLAADLTARTGTLGAALAIHFANNFSSLLLVGAAGPMSGLALFVIPIDITDPALRPYYAVEAGLMILAWLGARIVLRR